MPAARGLSGPPKCPRCSGLLLWSAEARAIANVSDCGLELDAFSRPARPLTAAPERLAADPLNQQLRRLERMLRPPVRRYERGDLTVPLATLPPLEEASEDVGVEIQVAAGDLRSADYAIPPRAPAVNLLLAAGFTSLVVGVLLLVAANIFLHPTVWRWGFAVTIAGEGLLITGLAAMATRLWRNSRCVNLQLDGIDRRLVEVQSTLTHAVGSVATSSLRGALRRLDRPMTNLVPSP